MGSMTRIFGKKQVLLATLIVALGVAVYLNYYFSSQQPPTTDVNGRPTSSTSSRNMGDAQFVGNSSVVSSPESTVDANDYFVQARLSRESAREEALDIVKDMMNDVKATDEIKKQAADKVEAVTKAIEQESKIESLIKAKGFTECLAYVDSGSARLVVQTEGLTAETANQIKDIILEETGLSAENISIEEING